MTLDSDYVLGTHDEEIARLGIQHQVWRPHMLDAWARAGMTRGSRVVDFGAGSGYATCDAAEIVGPEGQVTAIERSPHFLEFAGREMRRRNLSWISWKSSPRNNRNGSILRSMACAFGPSRHAQTADHHVVAARSPHQIAAQSQES